MESYCIFILFTQHNILNGHPVLWHVSQFFPCWDWIIVHCMYIPRFWFIYLLVDTWIASTFLAVVNMGVKISLVIPDFTAFGTYIKLESKDSLDIYTKVDLYVWFLKNCHTVVHSGSTIFWWTNNSAHVFQLLHILTNTWSFLFNNSHPNEYEVVSHCGLDFHFPND